MEICPLATTGAGRRLSGALCGASPAPARNARKARDPRPGGKGQAPKTTVPGRALRAARSARTSCGGTRMSSSTNSVISPRVARKPAFRAAAGPAFAWRSHRTGHGDAWRADDATSWAGGDEPSSTTTISSSSSGSRRLAASRSTVAARARPRLKVGTTTLTFIPLPEPSSRADGSPAAGAGQQGPPRVDQGGPLFTTQPKPEDGQDVGCAEEGKEGDRLDATRVLQPALAAERQREQHPRRQGPATEWRQQHSHPHPGDPRRRPHEEPGIEDDSQQPAEGGAHDAGSHDQNDADGDVDDQLDQMIPRRHVRAAGRAEQGV